MDIDTNLKWNSIKTRGTALIIEHTPCCLLSFAAASIGVSILNHNPILELGFAIGGAIIGEHLGHRYFFKKCHLESNSNRITIAKRYGVALAFGLATWGAHQVLFHNSKLKQPATLCSDPNQYFIYYSKNHEKSDSHAHTPICAFR